METFIYGSAFFAIFLFVFCLAFRKDDQPQTREEWEYWP